MRKHTDKESGSQLLSTRIISNLEWQHFKLESDKSRQTKHLCLKRRAMLEFLRGVCDPDGTHVEIAVATIAKKLGIGQSTVFRFLDDLKALEFLVDEQRLGYNQPRQRYLNLFKITAALGAPTAPRPDSLPVCISDALWHDFCEVFPVEGVELARKQIEHLFHLWDNATEELDGFASGHARAEFLVVEYLKFSMRIGFITDELWRNGEVECHVKGCFAYQPTEADWTLEWAQQRACEIYGGSK